MSPSHIRVHRDQDILCVKFSICQHVCVRAAWQDKVDDKQQFCAVPFQGDLMPKNIMPSPINNERSRATT